MSLKVPQVLVVISRNDNKSELAAILASDWFELHFCYISRINKQNLKQFDLIVTACELITSGYLGKHDFNLPFLILAKSDIKAKKFTPPGWLRNFDLISLHAPGWLIEKRISNIIDLQKLRDDNQIKRENDNNKKISKLKEQLQDRNDQLIREILQNISMKLEIEGKYSYNLKNEELLATLMEMLPNPVFVKDSHGIYLGCNKAFEKAVETDRTSIVGYTAFSFLSKNNAESLRQQDLKVLESNKSLFLEDEVKFRNGEVKRVKLYRSPFIVDTKTKEKGLIGVIVEQEDFTDTENFLRIQNDIDFVTWTKDRLEDSLEYVLKKLTQVSWIDAGGIYLFNEEKDCLELVRHIGLPQSFVKTAKTFKNDSPNVKFIKNNQAYFGNFKDFAKIVNGNYSNDFKALAIIPLRDDAQIVGALNLTSKSIDTISNNDQIAIRSLVSKLGTIISNIKARDHVKVVNEQLEEIVAQRTKALNETNVKLRKEIEFHKETRKALEISENLYQTIFNNAGNGIVLYDATNLKLVDVNPITYKFLGYTREEFFKLRTEDFTLYETEGQRKETIEKLFKVGHVSFNVRHRSKSGQLKYVIINASLVNITEKKYILGVISDVTQVKAFARQLKEVEIEMRDLQNNISIGLFRINQKGELIYANPFFLNLFGISEDLKFKTKKRDRELYQNVFLSRFIDDLSGLKSLHTKEISFKIQEGKFFYGLLKLRQSANKNNDIITFDGTLEDITQLKLTFNKLEAANKKISQINANLERDISNALKKEKKQQAVIVQKSKLESLGELAAGIAHEINQPLGLISLSFENLLATAGKKQLTHDYINRKFASISSNIERIRRTIDHVKTFSRDHSNLVLEKIDLNRIVKNCLLLVKTQYQNHNIVFNLSLSNELGYTIGTAHKVEQIILNLLSNAKHALEEKETIQSEDFQKEISIKTFARMNMVVLSLTDNGIGINKKDISKIFDPFYTSKPEWVGTGLGLSIVYGIVKEMRGEVNVRSKERKYTEFELLFPRFIK